MSLLTPTSTPSYFLDLEIMDSFGNYAPRLSSSIAETFSKTVRKSLELKTCFRPKKVVENFSTNFPIWFSIFFYTKLKFSWESTKAIDLFEDATFWDCD